MTVLRGVVYKMKSRSWLDYCNSVLAGVMQNTLEPLQCAQNATVRLIFQLGLREHVTPGLLQCNVQATSATGCLYVGAFNTNYVLRCTRYTWRNAQRTWTTLLRVLQAVRRIPACGYLQVIPTSLHGCVPNSESEHSYTPDLQPGIRYRLTFVLKLVK